MGLQEYDCAGAGTGDRILAKAHHGDFKTRIDKYWGQSEWETKDLKS